ncbi:MAG: ZIP family metal transporter [Verrucomicrobiota bacterium]|jgi:zinc transporter ZupT
MTAALPILIRVCVAFAVALGGGVLSGVLARTHRQLCALISLGAGTLLGVTVFAIGPECFEALRWWQCALGAASGYAVFALISKYLFHICPACAASHFDEAITHHFREIAVAMMIALAVHCTVDGLALAAGRQEQAVPGANRSLDLSITVAICVHKAPEGLALGALLLGAAFGRRRMFWWVAAVESTTILGGLLGWFVFPNLSPVWLALALAHAGGGFLFLATHAVLGEILKHEKKIVLVNFAIGFCAIGALVLLFHLRD